KHRARQQANACSGCDNAVQKPVAHARKHRCGTSARQSPFRADFSAKSTLASLVAPLRLVDHVNPAFPPDHAVLAMARAQRFERVLDFHGTSVALGPKATQ